MEIRELVAALLSFDALAARQWVADASEAGLRWRDQKCPENLGPLELAVAAGVVEMLAQRSRQDAPTWTKDVPPLEEPIYLVRSAESMPRLRTLCREEGPQPLRERGILAPPGFLTMV